MKKKLQALINNQYLEVAIRYLMAIVFIYASIDKIIHPALFAKTIYGYKILPNNLINIAAITMPYIELIAGVLLLFAIFPRPSATIINAMLFVFILAITFNLVRGHEFNCGCFSVSDTSHTSNAVGLLVRDILLFSVGLIVIFYKGRRKLSLQKKVKNNG